jgi:Zn-dependent M28 family amino/carboxypeptidase
VPAPVTAERLRAHVQKLAGEIGERHVFRRRALDAAADYIEGEWRAQGYEVHRQALTGAGVPCANLEISRTGRLRPDQVLLIGAHYDTVRNCPGANDNGSGVAALIEMARWSAGLDPGRTLRFVAFTNEERPFFATAEQGSMAYAAAARRRGDDIRLMVSLETMGYYSETPGSQGYPPLFRFFHPDRGNFLGLVSDLRSRSAMRTLASAFRAHADFPLETTAALRGVPGVTWSDHRSFWRQGYPAIMATDTAFYRYRHYHRHDDTPDKLTYRPFARATEGLARAFAALACDPADMVQPHMLGS